MEFWKERRIVTSFGLKRSQEVKDKISENHADMSGEHNPFFGKKHTEENIIKMKNKIFSEKTRNKMSKTRIEREIGKGKNNFWFGKQIPHGHKVYLHKTPLQGEILMHNWDELYATYLDSQNIKYFYEIFTFELLLNGKQTTYTPDLYLPETDIFIEIKGYWRDDSLPKFNKFKETYPNIKIELLMKEDLKNLGIRIRSHKKKK